MSEREKTKDIRKCPWCGETSRPKTSLVTKRHGEVKERRCSKCGKILAAYLESEGEFLKNIRAF
jgi:ribosomal protein S27AE